MTKFLAESIEFYRNSFPYYFTYKQKSDIAYSMQYLQYLNQRINNDENTQVISKMLIKSFVITSLSVIETTLLQELRHKKLQPRKMYNKQIILKSKKCYTIDTHYLLNLIKLKYSNHVIAKPSLELIIKKTIQNKLFDLDESDLGKLNSLRKLRNKIHLNTDTTIIDHDYNSFDFQSLELSKYYLIKIVSYYIIDVNRLL